jgi:hypothetical protein
MGRRPDGVSTSISPAIEDLKASTPPDCCIACDEKLPPGSTVLCRDPECHELYERLYQRDYKRHIRTKARLRANAVNAPIPPPDSDAGPNPPPAAAQPPTSRRHT